MTATIAPHDRICMAVSFAYDADLIAAMREIGGCTHDKQSRCWLVPILRLPSILALMECEVNPDVAAAYHALLRRMLADFAGSGVTVSVVKGKLQISGGGQLVRDCLRYHTVGILAVLEGRTDTIAAIQRNTSGKPKEWQPSLFAPATEPTVTRGDRLMHAGLVNAKKAADKKAAIAKRRRFGG